MPELRIETTYLIFLFTSFVVPEWLFQRRKLYLPTEVRRLEDMGPPMGQDVSAKSFQGEQHRRSVMSATARLC